MTAPFFGLYGLGYFYGKTQVLSEVSFEMERGEILALLGPNGSGKSTLMKVIAGILPLRTPSSAQIHFQGEETQTRSHSWRARNMTYVGADLHPEFPLTAHEAVRMGRICHGGTSSEDPEVRKAMEMTFCWTLRDRDLHTLSGGERQLVSLARAIAQGSRILLLDEALSRMDLNHQAEIGRLLRKLAAEGLSIILVAHDVNLASEWADTAVLLKGGKTLARGKMAEVLTEATVRELYPSVALSVGKNPITGTPKIFFGAKK